MHLCVVCHVDISHRRSNARYCSKECKKSKTTNGEWGCAVCGGDLSHRPRAKYCGDQCAKSARQQQKQEWRADPLNHERERLSRNESQNAKYRDDPVYREERKAASEDYRKRNPEIVRAKDKARWNLNSQDPVWVEKNRARKHTLAYHKKRNARAKERRAMDPLFSQKERDRGRREYRLHPERWVRGREIHKTRYHRDRGYRDTQRDYHRRWKYGLLPGEYTRKSLEQGRVCAICKGTNPDGRNLMVDHNHKSGQVRGLLCVNCNLGIGKVGENSQRLLAAVDYLKAPAFIPMYVPRLQVDGAFAGIVSPRRRLKIQEEKSRRGRSASLIKNYGIDIDQYGWLLEKGERVCWICRKPETAKLGRSAKRRARRVPALNVDHIHDATKKIRGLLCYNCNTGIGYFQHDIENLEMAAAYLTQWEGPVVQPRLKDE